MTAQRLPFTISNQSLTFYIKGRPFSLVRDHGSYAAVREHLLAPDAPHDPEWLHSMVDVRAALMRESQGRIVFDGDDIVFRGKPLHNVWVDKILDFRNAGETYSPIWNALDRLVHNPIPAAIERLPIFLERTKLGFLPDGRFIAFKGVNANYESARANLDGTRFTHQIGDKPRMAREDVDADPNQTCSHGLHVGAPGYVRDHYNGGKYALVLVAVDPVDVVAVPTDYDGEKMRVCGYEVIDHLDQDYSDELLGKLRNTVTGYTPEPVEPEIEPEDEDEDDVVVYQPGEVVKYTEFGAELFGVVGDGELVRGLDGDLIEPDEIVRSLDPAEITGAMVACERARVRIEGDTYLRDSEYTVVGYSDDDADAQDDADSSFWKVDATDIDGGVPVQNSSIKAVYRGDEQLFPRTKVEVEGDAVTLTSLDGHDLRGEAEALLDDDTVSVGDLVQVIEDTWPPAGVYPVVEVLANAIKVQTEHDGIVEVGDGHWHLDTRRS